MKIPRSRQQLGQEGFAALVIAIVLVLVLSLMTIGFAQLMRREERSALDKHLSSQAYYAAESGVNDAAKALTAGFSTQKRSCGYSAADYPDPAQLAIASQYLATPSVGGSGSGVSYTCLLIDPNPTSDEFCSVDDSESTITEIDGVDMNAPATSVPIDHMDISWQSACGDGRPVHFVTGGGHAFTPADSWPSTVGVLRLAMTPLPGGGTDRNTLINKTYTAFLYPNDRSSSPPTTNPNNYSAAPAFSTNIGLNGGAIVDGNCHPNSLPRQCNVRVGGLSEANYLLDLRSIYGKSLVTIKIYDFNGNQLRISNSQTLVDSTGKAQDVLRRIQVRIPTHSTWSHTDFGLDSMSGICKQLQVMPTDPSDNSNGSSRECSP